MRDLVIVSVFIILYFITEVKGLWRPTQDMTWNYVLEGDLDISSEKADVLDIDLFSNSPELIQQYHDAGKKIICYFSGGTLEDYRPDKEEFLKVDGLVQNKYKKWKGENWLDIRKEGLKPILTERIKMAVTKKCDAIEVDNLDGCEDQSIQKKWDQPLTREDAINFAKWLATTSHEMDISIGLKNSLFMIDEVGADFDFAINESCATVDYPECHLYKDLLEKDKKAVFGITYQKYLRHRTEKLCDVLDNLNISMIIKDKELIQDGSQFSHGKCPYYYVVAFIRKLIFWLFIIIISIVVIYMLYRAYISGKLKVWCKALWRGAEKVIIFLKKRLFNH